MEDRALAGIVALATGAGRGIGRAIAIGFAREGAHVCCTARTTTEVEDTASAIKSAGGTAIAVTADVRRLDSVENLARETVGRLGGIDILVINAGVSLGQELLRACDYPLPEEELLGKDNHDRVRARPPRPAAELIIRMLKGRALDAYPGIGARAMGRRHISERADTGTGRHRNESWSGQPPSRFRLAERMVQEARRCGAAGRIPCDAAREGPHGAELQSHAAGYLNYTELTPRRPRGHPQSDPALHEHGGEHAPDLHQCAR
jgi:hypothetical protein